jgi:glycosyltransferase involved in cell wall biosynthesis
LREHGRLGYRKEKMLVIPNGFDTDAFHPCPEARAWLRAQIGAPPQAPLIGLVARVHPAKDHLTWIQAAARIAHRRQEAHFVLCGAGAEETNRELMHWIQEARQTERFHLLGPREDVGRILAALDLAVSSSATEGFPNAIGEAMSCAIPCVGRRSGARRTIPGLARGVPGGARGRRPRCPPANPGALQSCLECAPISTPV